MQRNNFRGLLVNKKIGRRQEFAAVENDLSGQHQGSI